MDPATLYIAFVAATGGPERLFVGHFGSKTECEVAREDQLSRKSPRYTITKSYCWSRGDDVPDWLAVGEINGVPLDPKYRP